MQSLVNVTRDRAISTDPRIAHIDALIRVQGDGHLDLWSRHAAESHHRPRGNRGLPWKEGGMGGSVPIGLNGTQHVRVEWRFDVVDGRVLCCFEIAGHDGPEADEWAHRFQSQWDCARYDKDIAALDASLQNRWIYPHAVGGYELACEALRAEGRRKLDEQVAEYKRKQANRPPPLASPAQVAVGIPAIDDVVLVERAAIVRPLVMKTEYETTFDEYGAPSGFRSRNLGLHYIGPQPDLRGQSFTWSEDIGEPAVGLVAAKTVITLHTFGYHGMFKPSVAEVLAQAPDDLHEYVAFSIAGPDDADDLNRDKAALDAGFHVATVTYYRAEGAPLIWSSR